MIFKTRAPGATRRIALATLASLALVASTAAVAEVEAKSGTRCPRPTHRRPP